MSIYKNQFCVYLTTYSGNKLPPFYIGSTSIEKIKNQNYHGTVTSKKFKNIWWNEIENNPSLFKTFIISTHYSRKEAYEKEEYLQRTLNVVKSSMYINMSIANGNFVAEKGKKHSKEWCNNISKGQTGRKHSEKTKEKQSKSGGHRKGKNNSEEANEKNRQSNKLVIKTPEWNEKNSKAQKGRIQLANTITKKRRNLNPEDAEKIMNLEPSGVWIKLSFKKDIPTFN